MSDASQPARVQAQSAAVTNKMAMVAAVLTGLSIATLYYSQPLLPLIGKELEISQGMLLMVPFATQAGLAMGLLFLLPLGDWVNRRWMLRACTGASAVACLAISTLNSYTALLIAWFVLGLSCMAPYVIPAFLATLVPEVSRGRMLGMILSGHFAGILLSRSLSGIIATSLGWRAVFFWGFISMACVTLALNKLPRDAQCHASIRYRGLLKDQLNLLRRYPQAQLSCLSEGLLFGSFIGIWSIVAIHTAQPPLALSTQSIGNLGFVTVASICFAPLAGRLTDQFGALRVVVACSLIAIAGGGVLLVGSAAILTLAAGLAALEVGVQGSFVANQARMFGLDSASNNKLGALLFVSGNAGAALTTVVVAIIWPDFGWNGSLYFCLGLMVVALISQLHPRQVRRWISQLRRPTG